MDVNVKILQDFFQMGSNASQSTEGWVQDSRFGLIRLENTGNATTLDPSEQEFDTNTDTIFVKTKEMSSREYDHWKKGLKKMQEVRGIVLLPLCSKVLEKSYCGMNCSIELKFPSYRILLRQETKNRWKINKAYTESELWNLLYNLVSLGQYHERIGEKIGDVHPSNIVFNEEGFMRIIGKMTLPGQLDNFQKICNDQLADVFLAPEEIDYDCFDKYTYPPNVSSNTAELFSIGMTMLEAGTLQLSSYVYDKGRYRVNFSKMSENLKLFHLKYSTELYTVIQSLLSKNPSERMTCNDLYQSLRPFENKILHMEPFEWPWGKKNLHYEDSSNGYQINMKSSSVSCFSAQQKRINGKNSPRIKMYQSSFGEGNNI